MTEVEMVTVSRKGFEALSRLGGRYNTPAGDGRVYFTSVEDVLEHMGRGQ